MAVTDFQIFFVQARTVDGNSVYTVPKSKIKLISGLRLNGAEADAYARGSLKGIYFTIQLTDGQVISDAYLQAYRDGEQIALTEDTGLQWKQLTNCTVSLDNRKAQVNFCWKGTTLLPDKANDNLPPAEPACDEVTVAQLQATIAQQQQDITLRRVKDYQARYAQQCAAPATLIDQLTLTYQQGYHHFTLYYYDRAGNLMKTVPPAGVKPLGTAAVPPHTLVTRYKYNSLGQLLEQTSPDGGTTHFFYNRKGQLRFSQNAHQYEQGSYSYTRYDALGRVTEVGQSKEGMTAKATDLLAIFAPKVEAMLFPATDNVYQATRTGYGAGGFVLAHQGLTQRYLTNRVAYTYLDADGDPVTTSDNTYTYYSYDPHGNVEWLVQQVPGLGRKLLRYRYDLISNKVTQVAYQPGEADQFTHRYQYDEDNRLTSVQTSADGQTWEQDAQYRYYAHGPLQRMVLGDDQVQALDYAYTLQGWLKGINHPDLNKSLTTGQAFSDAADADGNRNGVAADAFGMTLGYFRGDYVRTGSYLNAAQSTAAGKGVLPPTATQELFNGNIASWTARSLEDNGSSQVAGTTTGEVFQYDQLNRLMRSRRFTGLADVSSATNTYWSVANKAFGTSYSYDPNGNLTKLTRRLTSASTYMDSLRYNYDPTNANRLLSVKDGVASSFSLEDVDSQPDNNYTYDEIGNLTKDQQAGVSKISWTPYGKIDQVTRADGGTTAYRYDAQGNRVRKVHTPATGAASTTYYVRDAQGNILGVYTAEGTATATLNEHPIYGSARVGERKPGTLSAPIGLVAAGSTYTRTLGQKVYELSDHLGNVRVVVTDEKTSTLSATTGLPQASSIQPVLSAYYNYYPFGQLQPGRYTAASNQVGGYRFGYNGKEKNDDIESNGNFIDFGDRGYDARRGQWWSVDKYWREYVPISPYSFALNNPIRFIDADGNIVVDGNGKPVTISVDVNGKPTYTFVDGTSEQTKSDFNKMWDKAFTAMAITKVGKEDIEYMQRSPTKFMKLKTSHRDPKLSKRSANIVEKGKRITVDGKEYFGGAKINLYMGSIGDQIKNQSTSSFTPDENEFIGATLSTEIGHTKPEQIVIDDDLHDFSPEQYQMLFNRYLRSVIEYRDLKKQPVDDALFKPFLEYGGKGIKLDEDNQKRYDTRTSN